VARTVWVLAVAACLACGGGLSADSAQAVERALGPYYGALVASARGNADATSRNLLLFASRWESAGREARRSPPAVIGQDPDWPALLDRVSEVIARARQLVRQQDVAGAHAELETIRLEIREIHARHHALTFDDYMTDYHEAVERVLGHVAGRNEIRLAPRDFADADEDLQAAFAAWRQVQATSGAVAGGAEWRAAAREVSAALDRTRRALAAGNAAEAGAAAERLKSAYYDLLLAVAKSRG
jgi:hypothetical protein